MTLEPEDRRTATEKVLDWTIGELVPAVVGFALFVGVAVLLVRLHVCFG